jgi:anti-anti-sigma regulatory factor
MAVAKKKAASPRTAKAKAARAPAAVIDAAPQEAAPSAPVKKSKTARFVLPANMEIAALGPVHAELAALEASNDGPFVLDGANLSVIDTAGLQLLISFVSAVQGSGKKISWDNYSVQAYQLASELGVVDQLGD